MGLPPLSPMVVIWSINVKDWKVSPAHHDPGYGPGELPLVDFFRGPPTTYHRNSAARAIIMYKYLSGTHIAITNTASILVLEASNIIKHNEFQ